MKMKTELLDVNSFLKKQKYRENVNILLFGSSRLNGVIGHLVAYKLMSRYISSFDCVYGSQIGSLFATLIAKGVKPEVLENYILNDLSKNRIFDLRVKDFLKTTIKLSPLNLNGACYGKKIKNIFEKLLQSGSKENILPLYTFAEQLKQNKLEIFQVPNQIRPIDAIMAATSVSAVFPPVSINNKLYIESGTFGPLPVSFIYKHQKSRLSKAPHLNIVAFQEGFTEKVTRSLSIPQRLFYSFHEKVRYHSVLAEIDNLKDYNVNLTLVSFYCGGLGEKSIVNMSKTEKNQLIQHTQEDVINQLLKQQNKIECIKEHLTVS